MVPGIYHSVNLSIYLYYIHHTRTLITNRKSALTTKNKYAALNILYTIPINPYNTLLCTMRIKFHGKSLQYDHIKSPSPNHKIYLSI